MNWSLRWRFVLVTSVLLTAWANGQARGQDARLVERQRAVELIRAAGGSVWLDNGRSVELLFDAPISAGTRVLRVALIEIAEPGEALRNLGVLEEIEELNLNRSGVMDDDLIALPKLQSLKSLSLRGAGITNAGLEHLRHAGKLERLFLDDTAIDDNGLEILGSLTSLKELKLNGTQIGPGLKHLRRLTKLETLNLSKCPVADADLEGLIGMPSLDFLYLGKTQATNGCIKSLKKLPKLQSLECSDTAITHAGIRSLRLRKWRITVSASHLNMGVLGTW